MSFHSYRANRLLPRFVLQAQLLSQLLCMVGSASAALVQTENWALTTRAEAFAGYDSNLFARADGEGDGFFRVAPFLTLQRLNSLTDLRVVASVQANTFFKLNELNTTDPALRISLRYPSDLEILSTHEIDLRAVRSSEANSEAGGRLRWDDFGLRAEKKISLSGKTLLEIRTAMSRIDYLTRGYNTNDSATGGFTLALVKNEKLQLGAGYDYQYDRSEPDDSFRLSATRNGHLFTLRARGELLPKVTGQVFLGITHDAFQGAYERSDWDFAARANMNWAATARGQLAVTAERMTYFSPDGNGARYSRARFEWTQEFAGGLSFMLGLDADRVVYYQRVSYRHDKVYGAYIQLRYAMTERFSANVQTGYSKQNSDQAVVVFDRSTVQANATYRF